MVFRKRRRSDLRDFWFSWRTLPHYYLYAVLGFFLGLGSPIGALGLRFWLASPELTGPWIIQELNYNFLFYSYMSVGTVVAFAVFGYALGLRYERQNMSNRMLSARIEELHLKSVTDALTGAFTYGYLYEVLGIEIQHALTEKMPLSVMILDIDDFKRINDSHGHLFGDRVIKETAETISAHVRTTDILGRYGGDEFVVVMPETDEKTAKHVAERVRAGIAKNGYMTTVSIGVATTDGTIQGSNKPGDILHRADMNLYQAKHDGRNCVRVASADTAKPQRRRDDVH